MDERGSKGELRSYEREVVSTPTDLYAILSYIKYLSSVYLKEN